MEFVSVDPCSSPCSSSFPGSRARAPLTIYAVRGVNPDVNDAVLTRVPASARPSYTDEDADSRM